MKFYTSVFRQKNHILEIGYEDGERFERRIEYSPYLFRKAQDGYYRTIHGESCERIDFDTMVAASAYVKQNSGVVGSNIYGLTDFPYLYIYDNYVEGFEYDFNQLSVVNIDIENDSSNGWANIETADKEITAITFAKNGRTLSFGFFPYESSEDALYYQCDNEVQLLKRIIRAWNSKNWRPDIVSGWNVEGYDIPYIVNRIRRVLGEEWVNKLSPFGIVKPREAKSKTGKVFNTYTIVGVSVLDYMALYLKFAQNQRESYKLDYIAEIEIGQKKVDYSEYGSLDGLYRNNFKLFMDYNKQDSLLIGRLEDKLHYIAQGVSMAYIQRVNFENILATVKPWDIICHNYLLDHGIVIPQFEKEEGDETIIGGYVKDPVPGNYTWLVAFDFTSLYPSVVIQYNISPDMFVQQTRNHPSVEEIITGDISRYTKELIERDMCMTANGAIFRRANQGFLPALMQKFFDERVRIRKLEAVAKTEHLKDETRDDLRNIFLKYKNLQTGYKLINVSGYGAIANPYCRWFSNALAEGITTSGQLTTQYVIYHLNKKLNALFGTDDFDYVVYADTDSAYVSFDRLVDKLGIRHKTEKEITQAIVDFCKKEIQPFIDETSQELGKKMNCFTWKTSMKLEKVCSQAFFIKKKKYALYVNYDEGDYYTEPKIKVTGLETVRSSSPKVVRDALKKCFGLIFSKNRDSLALYIEEFKKDFRKMPFDKVGKPSGLNNFHEYLISRGVYKKGVPVHVRGAYVYNDFLEDEGLENSYEKIVDHDKVKWAYLVNPNPFFSNVLSIKGDTPKGLNIEKYVDYDLQFEKTFLAPIRKVAEAVGWDIEVISYLDDMFGED